MKKCFVFFLFVFLLVHHKTYAQGFIWAQAFQGINLSKMVVDDSDNIYTVGSFKDSVDIDPNASLQMLFSVGQNNLVIVKQDNAGNLLWAKQIKGRVWAPSSAIIGSKLLMSDKMGNLYMAGFFIDSFDFDPGPNDFWMGTAVNANNQDAFILKLSPNGDFIWVKHFIANSTSSIALNGLIVKENNIYLSGVISGTVDVDPGPDTINTWPIIAPYASILEKLDTAGNFHWVKPINGVVVGSILADSIENIYALGSFHFPVDVDPGAGTVLLNIGNSYGNFIERFDSAGNYQWVKIINAGKTSTYCQVSSWKLDRWNNFLLAGVFKDTVDFDPGLNNVNLIANCLNNNYSLKLKNNGDFCWVKSSGCMENRDLVIDSSGNSYSTCTLNSGSVYTQKLDSAGNLKWHHSYNATSSMNMLLNNANQLYINGSFVGTNIDLDPGISKSLFNAPSPGAGYIQKLCTDSYPVTITADTTIACFSDTVHLSTFNIPGATYIWSRNDVPIPNSNNDTLIVTQSGAYKVEIYGVGCPSISDTSITVTITPYNNPTINIYRSPDNPQAGQQVYLNAVVGNTNGNPYTINWFLNGVLFSTTLNATYIKQTGTDLINVIVTVPNTCSIPVSVNYFINAISEINTQPQLILFPNPAKDQITVQYTQGGSLSLMDIAGRQLGVYTLATGKKTETIDISSLAKGVYLLRFSSNEGAVETVKVVKE